MKYEGGQIGIQLIINLLDHLLNRYGSNESFWLNESVLPGHRSRAWNGFTPGPTAEWRMVKNGAFCVADINFGKEMS